MKKTKGEPLGAVFLGADGAFLRRDGVFANDGDGPAAVDGSKGVRHRHRGAFHHAVHIGGAGISAGGGPLCPPLR